MKARITLAEQGYWHDPIVLELNDFTHELIDAYIHKYHLKPSPYGYWVASLAWDQTISLEVIFT